MSNGNDRRGDEPVTKMKSGAAMIKTAALRSSEGRQPRSEAIGEGIGLNEFAESAIIPIPRSRKCGKPDVADQIGGGLRSMYDDVLLQPVPDRFFDLLRQLERVGGPQLKKDAQ